ncbi:MAG: signal peptide peptidase SppA [Prevotellaceae bacterium]|jgi:protease-4|nr:signal peptide peptidase SppA [Prevotellaceae bacterium]
MKNSVKTMFAAMLGVFLAGVVILAFFAIVFGAIISASFSFSAPSVKAVKNNSVLALSLNHPIVDRVENNPMNLLQDLFWGGESVLGLNDILRSIEHAKTDSKIEGILLIDMGDAATGIATLTEIRNALLDFRLTGKFVVSYSDAYGQKPYYLASVADKIYMNPEGSLNLHGLGASVMFYKGALDKLGVEAQVIRHGKFKSAVEPYMYDKMSAENREQILAYTGAIWQSMLGDIVAQRHMGAAVMNNMLGFTADDPNFAATQRLEVNKLNEAINTLQLSSAEAALKLNLIDGLRQRGELLSELAVLSRRHEDDNPSLIPIDSYSRTIAPKNITAKQRVAVVYAQGEILDEGRDGGIVGKTLAAELRAVRRDSSIKAVVLRVNSPGGSAQASELIWHEMQLLKEAKPLVVSMGDVAASGGYYIACPASYIVANPTTITGSIGVFGVLFNAKNLLNNKLGLTVDVAATNEHADMGSIYRPLSKPEHDFFLTSVEKVYATFAQHVADGRNIPVKEVDNIGQGRVWSGTDAKRIKLIDEFGGLNAAIEKAVLLANLESYKVIELPRQKDKFAFVLESLGQAAVKLTKKGSGNILEDYEPLAKLLRMHGKVQARLPYNVSIE